ncbi:unnamed protein product [Oppiella nova]|uniref:Dolichyl-diphosphooligosaccharide-protein glycosyltransferase subunit TMEM258 n=1 Tax=Oppiella nova TaxID=334625 RepID=A0A7R9LRK9_9ACAR|nr:unnamed protein product [Oppiella nova]CAG2166281.1 unnamed protein product [Oppiella nova]
MLDNVLSLSSYQPLIPPTIYPHLSLLSLIIGVFFMPLIPPTIYPHLSLLSLIIGVFFMAWFFTLEVTSKSSSNIVKELTTSLIGSAFIGFGTVFLLLSVGIYV